MARDWWIAAQKAEGFPITATRNVAEVSTTAFNGWRRREAAVLADAEREEAALVETIREIQRPDLRMAAGARGSTAGIIFHGDRGS